MKKSIIAMMAVAAVAVALIGCNKTPDQAINDFVQDEFMSFEGEWEIPEDVAVTLTDEEAEIFNSAMNLVGVDYEPYAVIATQVVSGTNRAYLCKGTLVTPEGGTSWYVVTVYTDLSGESKVLDVKEFDIDNPFTADEQAENLLGGWTAVEPAASGISGAAAEAYDKAMDGVLGVDYKPIALLGSADNGTYYLVLAYGKPVSPDAAGSLYLIEVVANNKTEGIEMTGRAISQLDLLSYV